MEKQTHPQEQNMDLPKRDKSKTVWMVIVIVLLATLIGLGVYGFIQMKNMNQKISDQQAKIDDLNAQKRALEEAAANASKTASEAVTNKNEKYLEITQFGVEFLPGQSIPDLRYVLKTAELPIVLPIFESPTLNKTLNTNATTVNACGPGSLGSISRGKLGQQFLSTTYDKASGNVKVGDYYYVYQGPGSGCGGSESNVATLEKAWNEMAQSMSTLRVIQ